MPSLLELFQDGYYSKLEGGLLEACGRLFTQDLRVYVYPLITEADAQLALDYRKLSEDDHGFVKGRAADSQARQEDRAGLYHALIPR